MLRAAILALLSGYGASVAAQEIVEFPIPPPPTGIHVVDSLAVWPDGVLWFTQNTSVLGGGPPLEQIPVGGGLARITDEGVITASGPPCGNIGGPPFSGVEGLAATNDGNLWIASFASDAGQATSALTPCLSGVPGIGATLPGLGTSLIAGSDGNLWFILTSPGGPPQVGRVTTNGLLTTYSLPVGTGPVLLASGPDGNIWFTESQNRIGRMTTSGSVTLFDLPTSNALPAAITPGPDGNLWFVESGVNQIGRIRTTGSVAEYPIPTPDSHPFGITAGADGAIWFAEGVGKIGRVTTAGAFSEIRVPYPDSQPTAIVGKPDGTVWFTDTPPGNGGSSRIGRLSPTAGCVSDPHTLCLSIGAFSVTASFQRTPDAAFTPASAAALTGNTGYFWFFDPANVEMTVKVLDGCGVNGNYWVFAGGMTNVGVEWKVTRSQTNAVQSYSNPSGTAFEPVQDTAAFPCL